MLIDLRELLSGSQDEKSYKADIEMNTFNTGSSDYDIIDKPAVDVIIKKLGKNKLSIKADSYVTLSIPCDRCLEPVDTRVDYTVDGVVYAGAAISSVWKMSRGGEKSQEDDLQIVEKEDSMETSQETRREIPDIQFKQEMPEKEEAKEEKDYIDGYDLDVDKLVFGEILISMPGKTLCKEGCKGICLICGANLNKGECGCDRDILDPRMSVFKDILKNFKEV